MHRFIYLELSDTLMNAINLQIYAYHILLCLPVEQKKSWSHSLMAILIIPYWCSYFSKIWRDRVFPLEGLSNMSGFFSLMLIASLQLVSKRFTYSKAGTLTGGFLSEHKMKEMDFRSLSSSIASSSFLPFFFRPPARGPSSLLSSFFPYFLSKLQSLSCPTSWLQKKIFGTIGGRAGERKNYSGCLNWTGFVSPHL